MGDLDVSAGGIMGRIGGREGAEGAFLLGLSDRLRTLENPESILEEAAAALGTHLGASRAGYAEVQADGDTFIIERDWTDGSVKQGTGRRSIAAFGPEVAASLRRGETQRYEDARIDPRVSPAHRAAFEEMTIAAIVTVPLVKAGRLVAMFSVQKSRPCVWRDADVWLIEEVAERTWAAHERAKTAARLRESEATFGFLLRLSDRVRPLNNPAEMLAASLELLGRELEVDRAGYAEIDAEAGVLVIDRDWTSGRLPSIVGRHPLESFGRSRYRALAAGQTVCVEDTERSVHIDEKNRLIHDALTIRASVTVPLVKDGRLVALLSVQAAAPRAWKAWEQRLVEEVAERTWAALEHARAEAKLRDTQALQTFLLALGDRVRRLGDPAEVLAASNEMLGAQLGANRVGYAEIDPADQDVIVVAHDWTDGSVPSVVGRHSFLAFGERHCAVLRGGGIFRLADATDGRLSAEERPAYDAMRICAAVSVPLIKQDRLIAVLSVHQDRPRQWTDAEVLLMQEVAERTWAALEQSRAEAQRRESQDLFRAFLDNAPIGMFLKDPEGRYILVNGEMAKVLGVPRAEALGKTALEVLGREEAARVEEEEKRAFAEGRAQVRDQFFPERQDHSSAQLFRFPVLLEGRPPRIGGFAVDTTERLRAEAELARSREALYQSEKLTALGSLLAGVSHELNNPLAVVVGQAMMLEEDAAGTPHAERAGKIRRSAERCAKIVQTFLAMARQRPPERALVDANAVVRAALDLTSYGLRSAGISVECALAPDLPRLHADADQLHQVLANLFVNAQQALQEVPGARRLSIATRANAAAGTVELEIADTGPGVSPEIRRRVFEPFFTTKPQGVGTGLGLSFSLGVVEAHGGRLELLDRAEGAAFLLTLPAAEPIAVPVPPNAPGTSVHRPARGHALVVDDEEEIADMLAELLEAQGFRVRLAASGAEAKRQLAARDFDLILSDLRMPDVDGPALHAWIAAERPALLDRLGFVTGDTLGPNAVRFLADAGRPTLEKPFTPAGLRAFVASVAPTT
jgi:PAS domain S-box-containing protein